MRRTLSNVEYYLSEEPLPTSTFSNPALVVLGCSRLDAIITCFNTILQLHGIEKYTLYLSMGCPNRLSEDVDAIQHSHSQMIRHYMSQHFGEKTERITLLDYGSALSHSSNKRTALYRIHLHYNAMMRRLFEERNHSHVLVVEDDLQLAPTALLFAQQVVPALDADPSLVCLSLFNDNAYAP